MNGANISIICLFMLYLCLCLFINILCFSFTNYINSVWIQKAVLGAHGYLVCTPPPLFLPLPFFLSLVHPPFISRLRLPVPSSLETTSILLSSCYSLLLLPSYTSNMNKKVQDMEEERRKVREIITKVWG